MDILAIGNSFSQDAMSYLKAVAANQKIAITCENLYIGGCPLEQHFRNMMGDKKIYELEFNGEPTRHFISIKEALTDRLWDVVTIQQASHCSPFYSTFQPFANELVKFIREMQPTAKVFIHQTWAYEEESQKLKNLGFNARKDMFANIKANYDRVAEESGADGIIPCGQVLENMAGFGIKCHRDTFHASLGAGRYALALTWIKALKGASIVENTFNSFAEPVSDEEIANIKKSVNMAFGE